MRKKLTVVQLVCILISGLLTLCGPMLTYSSYLMPSRELYKTGYISLCNVMVSNYHTIHSVHNLIEELRLLLICVFYIMHIIVTMHFFHELYFKKKTNNNNIFIKDTVLVSVFSFVLGLIMIDFANNAFTSWDTFIPSADYILEDLSANVVAYIELVLLAIIPLIEIYKHFKCADKPQSIPTAIVNQETTQSNVEELKKYKELFDQGVITEEEFDAKKKQLLGL